MPAGKAAPHPPKVDVCIFTFAPMDPGISPAPPRFLDAAVPCTYYVCVCDHTDDGKFPHKVKRCVCACACVCRVCASESAPLSYIIHASARVFWCDEAESGSGSGRALGVC